MQKKTWVDWQRKVFLNQNIASKLSENMGLVQDLEKTKGKKSTGPRNPNTGCQYLSYIDSNQVQNT